MNEDITKLLTIALVFIIGMVSAGAVLLTTDSDNDGDSVEPPIQPEPVNQLPVASMYASSVVAHPYEEVTFDGSSSIDPDGTIISYKFDFGDGETAEWQEDSTATYTYPDVGEYTASLVVKDSNNTLSQNTMEMVIVVREQDPEDVITASSRSMEDFEEAFESVESSPLSIPPLEENPVEEEVLEDPTIGITDVPYEETTEDPDLPEPDCMEIPEENIDLEFQDLGNENAGYDSSRAWEDAETTFIASFDGIPDAGPGDLDDDHLGEFTEDFASFNRHRDTDDTGKHFNYRTINVVNVSVEDSDGDGNPESTHIQAMSYEALGRQENPRYESLYASELRMYDNNSNGNHNYLRINQFGFESVDKDGDGNPEYSLISLRVVLVYDNNSDGNPEYAGAFEVTFVRVDRNDDGHAEYQVAHFRKLDIWDENSDGNFKLLVAFEWNVRSLDKNNDTNNEYASVSGKSLVIYDNSSDGNPNYAQYKHFGIASKDKNDDGTNELYIAAFENWVVRDNKDNTSDGNPEVVQGSKAYVRHNSVRNSSIASFENLILFDNSSDGTHNHINYGKAAWVARDNNSDGNKEFEAIKLEGLVYYNNDTSNQNPSFIHYWRFTAAQWDQDSDGEPEGRYYDAEVYVMEDEDQDGNPEVEWHVEYKGNGEEEEEQ